jgi:hypothetical protein
MEIRMLLTTGVVVTNLAATLNEVYAAWLGGLITLKKHHFQLFYFISREITSYLPDHSNTAMEHRLRYCTKIPDGYVRV